MNYFNPLLVFSVEKDNSRESLHNAEEIADLFEITGIPFTQHSMKFGSIERLAFVVVHSGERESQVKQLCNDFDVPYYLGVDANRQGYAVSLKDNVVMELGRAIFTGVEPADDYLEIEGGYLHFARPESD